VGIDGANRRHDQRLCEMREGMPFVQAARFSTLLRPPIMPATMCLSTLSAVLPTTMTTITSPGRMTSGRQPGRPATTPRFDQRLLPLIEKVEQGRRLWIEDGLLLYESPDLWTVCSLADLVRRRLHGEVAYYNINRHLNYSNVCALSCTFCSFYRKKGQEGAYEHSLDQIAAEATAAASGGATEIHIVGGLHPWLPFDYYLDMMRTIRTAAPRLHIKAFTAVEIVHFARIAKRGRDGYEGIKSILRELKDAGLGSLPGGGAEVFDDRVHDEAFKGKIRAGTWLEVHRAAHEIGLNSNATMLYGHVEQRAERIRHMDVLRRAQDVALARLGYKPATDRQDDHAMKGLPAALADWPGGVVLTRDGMALPQPSDVGSSGGYFQAIIPLPFFPHGSALEHLPGPTGLENLRTLAIARLMLDNFPHVKAFWIMQTLQMAQLMLQNGADDIDGTVVWYDITKVGGADTHQEVTTWELERAIREAGFRPVERDTLYRPVVREADATSWRVMP
jgi:aminodeoxyfutalosine synthase